MDIMEFGRVFHWGPLIALSIIFSISTSSIVCIMMWWPLTTTGGIIHFIIYIMWMYLTLYYFLGGMYTGPGHVPYDWMPENEEDVQYLQYCELCETYKAPRSHHCRKCDRCVMKMDHHCPWINNCCGHRNHRAFTLFLFFAPCGCIHSLVILMSSLYRAVNAHYYIYYGSGDEPIVVLGLVAFLACIFATGLAIGVILAVGGLCVVQLKSILKNETGIESWIIEKAEYRQRADDEPDFVYPYDLGKWNNLKQVFTWKGTPVSNGLVWDVREGCDQYTLTMEQIAQKKEKKDRAIQYTIVEKYSGSWFPISRGLKVCCCPPCTDESRIAVKPGDEVLVTRWKSHWLYGELLHPKNEITPPPSGRDRKRGWFPRKCAVELVNNGCTFPNLSKKDD